MGIYWAGWSDSSRSMKIADMRKTANSCPHGLSTSWLGGLSTHPSCHQVLQRRPFSESFSLAIAPWLYLLPLYMRSYKVSMPNNNHQPSAGTGLVVLQCHLIYESFLALLPEMLAMGLLWQPFPADLYPASIHQALDASVETQRTSSVSRQQMFQHRGIQI